VEDVQRNACLLRGGDEFPPALRVRGERFVGDRRHAGGDRLQHQRAAGVRRGGDGDRVDPGGEKIRE
jgi:hypothetical protein